MSPSCCSSSPGPKRLIPGDGATGDQADSLGSTRETVAARHTLRPAGLADISASRGVTRSYGQIGPDEKSSSHIDAESKIGRSGGRRQHPAERQRSRVRAGSGAVTGSLGQAVSWRVTFLPDSRSSSVMSWRLRRSGARRSCQSGPRSVKRAAGSQSRCQMMVRMELPTATRARCLPRRLTIRL